MVIAQSGTTSLLIQMSNNAAAPPIHTCKHTHAHTGWRLSLHMQIHIIDLSPSLPSPSHAPFFIFNEWLVDLAARYRYVSIKRRRGSVLIWTWSGRGAEQHRRQRSKSATWHSKGMCGEDLKELVSTTNTACNKSFISSKTHFLKWYVSTHSDSQLITFTWAVFLKLWRFTFPATVTFDRLWGQVSTNTFYARSS